MTLSHPPPPKWINLYPGTIAIGVNLAQFPVTLERTTDIPPRFWVARLTRRQ